MDNMIVTVTDLSGTYYYDIEVPSGVPLERLKGDIVEALNGYSPGLLPQVSSVALFCNRTGKQLQPEETMTTAGVWSGDYITVIEV